MHIQELAGYLERELSFPITRSDVVQELGDVCIDCPGDPSEDIARILSRTDEETYVTPAELHLTILGAVNDGYIGRKYYDDRGTNPEAPRAVTEFEADPSF